MSDTFTAVRACVEPLLAGVILHARGVTAGRGKIIDWRSTLSGETIQEGADAFDTAQLFVAIVGGDEARTAVAKLRGDVAAPEITAFAVRANGGRCRAFHVGPYRVAVDPHEDDAGQAAFTARLAELAMEIEVKS